MSRVQQPNAAYDEAAAAAVVTPNRNAARSLATSANLVAKSRAHLAQMGNNLAKGQAGINAIKNHVAKSRANVANAQSRINSAAAGVANVKMGWNKVASNIAAHKNAGNLSRGARSIDLATKYRKLLMAKLDRCCKGAANPAASKQTFAGARADAFETVYSVSFSDYHDGNGKPTGKLPVSLSGPLPEFQLSDADFKVYRAGGGKRTRRSKRTKRSTRKNFW